ncbi:MAG: DUF2155 domain-containing protein [Paracoccaceae bacterium]|nr:DUF2155 domain-containing protein [Paracoccaceae bacterium]
MKWGVVCAVLLAVPVQAQTTGLEGKGAVVRWLDKVSGETGDLDLALGQSGQSGRLTIQLDDCRYPEDGVATQAYAHLTIHDRLVAAPVFTGWMLAESPALSALDSSRYDVWVLRCLTE